MRLAAAAAVLLGLMAPPTFAQAPPPPASADRYPAVQWLLLKRAYLDVQQHEHEVAATENGRTGEADRRARLERARLEYGAILASLVPVVPRLVVESAVKRQQARRGPVVEIGVRSQPLEWPEAVQRVSSDALEADLRSLATIRGALVSIKNATGTVIGLPFQASIPALDPGQRAMARFHMQDATSTIVVALSYAGRVEEHSVRLAGEGAAVRLDSAQVAQEADLGGTATYDLRLERTTSSARILRLLVDGLPAQFRHEFILDPKPGAIRLSQYRFHDEELVRSMLLRVQVPEALDTSTAMLDAPLRFRARVVEASSPANGEGSAGARVDLELIPRGVGRLTLQSSNFLVEGTEGAPIAARVEVKNVGSRDVQDVKPGIEVPTGWMATVAPTTVPLLRPNESKSLDIALQTGGAAAGDYTVKVRAAGSGASRDASVAMDLRVRVVPRGNVAGMLGFLGALLGLVAAVAYVGVRLARS